MVNPQIVAGSIVSVTAIGITILIYIFLLKKEKQMEQRMVVGDIPDIEQLKDYELLAVSGKQLKDFKKYLEEEWRKNYNPQ